MNNKKSLLSTLLSPVHYFIVGITAPFKIFTKKNKKIDTVMKQKDALKHEIGDLENQINDKKKQMLGIDKQIDDINNMEAREMQRKKELEEKQKKEEMLKKYEKTKKTLDFINEINKVEVESNIDKIKEKKINNKKYKKEIDKEFNDLSGEDVLKNQGINTYLNKTKKSKNKKEKELVLESSKKKKEELGNKDTYIYEATTPEGKKLKGKFDAYSKADVIAFLTNEGFTVSSIKTSKYINFLYGSSSLNHVKYNKKQLTFFLTQLATYIKAGIPLIDAMRIFARQEKNIGKKKILQSIIYELVMGEAFSDALTKQGSSFPPLLINMVKTAEMTGELAETLEDMGNYYSTLEKTRKQIISALTYPSMVFVMCIGIVTFIMIWVVPQFVSMYEDLGSELPMITQIVVGMSNFLINYWYIVFGGLFLIIFLFVFSFKKVKVFRKLVQTIIMKIPVIGKVIIYSEITTFSKTFASLINHNVFITDSMEILSKITSNEIYKELIYNTINNLSKGETISKAFENHWAFSDIAYEMIVTGERTGELGPMMERVATFYSEQHENIVSQLKSFIEPVTIAFLAFMVGGLLLAVIIPMFSLYNEIG